MQARNDDDRNDDETYINVHILEVVVDSKDDEGCVEHEGEDGSKNEEDLLILSASDDFDLGEIWSGAFNMGEL